MPAGDAINASRAFSREMEAVIAHTRATPRGTPALETKRGQYAGETPQLRTLLWRRSREGGLVCSAIVPPGMGASATRAFSCAGDVGGRRALLACSAVALGLLGHRLACAWATRRRLSLLSGAYSKRAVLITGCDTGLGFSLALRAHDLGLWVFATCLRGEGAGARRLREMSPRMQVLQMDVTDGQSVFAARDSVVRQLKRNNLELGALVNNAAVMVFGEFEWQTERLIKFQTDVNLLGTFRVTKAFCPELRKSKGRIITVSSHCAQATLPGLAVYGATKAGIEAWSDGLRMELQKYGINVITVLPGSFSQRSNIGGQQGEFAAEMRAAMNQEQKDFYGEYFERYQKYLAAVFSGRASTLEALQDPHLYRAFEEALLSQNPRAKYEAPATFRYNLYHFLFKWSPTTKVHDWLVEKFVQLPKWKVK
ncbi:D-beta-hydroxybutyrate dehydrogenase, mitochondrial [Ischnura elegans]|uniref:D-beta-hydroxybutyrate dehydrogenase, mitochondrial n=1 Tax=Ischnura elegans TaxID=197161 RepID=UPI001ED88935|nr:D-beta-hydroxybutyrate dehydrogenase, mitochondrial [Ischnura elegans]